MESSIQFIGGTGTVTGSKFLLRVGARQILIDCGLFQGLKELRLKNWAPLPFDPKEIDAVILTHAHLDHSGSIPLLTRGGFKGKIYCSSPTRDLAKVILLDSAKIQEEDAERANREGFSKHKPALPLYTVVDAHNALKYFHPVGLHQWISIAEGVEIRLSGSGHILGSTLIEIRTPDWTTVFTGDLGRSEPLILHPPEVIESADFLVTESTYGDRTHSQTPSMDLLGNLIQQTVLRKGHVVIPSFAVGRTQDILFLLSRLKNESKIADLPVFLDSPMGINATEIFESYSQWHRLSEKQLREMMKLVTLVKSQQQSEEILHRKQSSIVIAGSGMLTGGRVLTHLMHRLPDEKNTVILTGYQAASTRGSLLRNGASELKIYGQYYPVRAQIAEISTLSAHADQKDLIHWLGNLKKSPKQTFIVHGEPQASQALRVRIQDQLGWPCQVPHPIQVIDLHPSS